MSNYCDHSKRERKRKCRLTTAFLCFLLLLVVVCAGVLLVKEEMVQIVSEAYRRHKALKEEMQSMGLE